MKALPTKYQGSLTILALNLFSVWCEAFQLICNPDREVFREDLGLRGSPEMNINPHNL